MKPFEIEPESALLCGLLVAPVACAFNSLSLQLFLGGAPRHLFADTLNVGFSSLILTFPLGWMTARLLEIWRKGRFAAARALGLCFGLFSVALWAFLWNTFSHQWHAPEIGALAIPFLWSMLIPLLAVFARAPKP